MTSFYLCFAGGVLQLYSHPAMCASVHSYLGPLLATTRVTCQNGAR